MEGKEISREVFDQKVVFTNDKDKAPEVIEAVRESLYATAEESIAAVEKHALPPAEVFGEMFERRVQAVQEKLRDYFVSVGIASELVQFNPVYILPLESDDMSVPAELKDYHIELYDLPIDNANLKLLMALRALAHEYYHNAAITRRTLRFEEQDGGVDVSAVLARHGMTYHNEDSIGRGNALEEGLAVYIEQSVFEDLKKSFEPASVELFDKITALAETSMVLQNQDLVYRPDMTFIKKSDAQTGDVLFGYPEVYQECLELVEYLAEQIPDFFVLVEESRIHGNALRLARAIEKRFGAGSYRTIVETPNNAAYALLEQLQSDSLSAVSPGSQD